MCISYIAQAQGSLQDWLDNRTESAELRSLGRLIALPGDATAPDRSPILPAARDPRLPGAK
jgi:hypothetical protein